MGKKRKAKGIFKLFEIEDTIMAYILFISFIIFIFPYALIVLLIIGLAKCLFFNKKKTFNSNNNSFHEIEKPNNKVSKKYKEEDDDEEDEEFNKQADYFGLSKREREICKLENMSPEEFIEAEEEDIEDEW